MPNASIPNGDRINDNFKVSGIGLQSVDMTIYNRWGQIVFQQSSNSPIWNGKNQKYGTDCDGGVYVYIVKAKDSKG